MGRSKALDQYLAEEPELRRAYDTEPEARQILDTAKGLGASFTTPASTPRRS